MVHRKAGPFCGGKELRCNLMFWLRGGKRLLITRSYLLLLSSLSQLSSKLHNSFLYSLNFSKNQRHQALLLLFYLNQSSVWTDMSELPWGKCKHKDNVKRADSRSQTAPDLAQALTAAQAWAQNTGLAQCYTDLSVLGSVFGLTGRWNVDVHRCNYILTRQCPQKERQNPLIATFTSLHPKHRNSSWEAANWNVWTSGADLSFTHRSKKLLGLVLRLKRKKSVSSTKPDLKLLNPHQLLSALMLFGQCSDR